jgi:hypothetical protein
LAGFSAGGSIRSSFGHLYCGIAECISEHFRELRAALKNERFLADFDSVQNRRRRGRLVSKPAIARISPMRPREGKPRQNATPQDGQHSIATELNVRKRHYDGDRNRVGANKTT